MKAVTFPIALRGLGSEFSESSQQAEYARELENRFINLHGAAEKIPGLKAIVSPSVTGHFDCQAEHINSDGSSTFLATRISDSGTARELYKYTSTGWALIGNLDTNANGFSAKVFSRQMGDKTIFVASDMLTAFYSGYDGGVYRLWPKIVTGRLNTNGATVIMDSDISDWINSTNVAPLDIAYNVTRNAFAVVTSVGTTALDITYISSAGGGGIALGVATGQPKIGDYYIIIDAVANNVIRGNNVSQDADNIAIAGAGTTSNVIAVSGVDFSTTQIRRGDFIYNTTKASLQAVESVSAALTVTNLTTASAGDTLLFLKPAISYLTNAHVHYGRFYGIDERDRTKVIESGPDDPEDYTTFRRTINSGVINYGAKQPDGEEILALSTFQKYLVAAGRKNVYLSDSNDPSTEATAASTVFVPVGLFSQGAIGRTPIVNIGSRMLYISRDGARQFNVLDVLQVKTDNISEAIKTELRKAIRDTDESDIQVIHYPTRNWVMFKIGNIIYNYNYSKIYYQGQEFEGGTWSKITGMLAECDTFVLRQDGVLQVGRYSTTASSTYFYEFDTGSYTDDTRDIATKYTTSWLSLAEGGGVVCDGRYIKTYFENTSDVAYSITATSDLSRKLNSSTIVVSAAGSGAIVGVGAVGSARIGGSRTSNEGKYPLRWRGEQFKVSIETAAGRGEDIISKFIIYGNTYGLE